MAVKSWQRSPHEDNQIKRKEEKFPSRQSVPKALSCRSQYFAGASLPTPARDRPISRKQTIVLQATRLVAAKLGPAIVLTIAYLLSTFNWKWFRDLSAFWNPHTGARQPSPGGFLQLFPHHFRCLSHGGNGLTVDRGKANLSDVCKQTPGTRNLLQRNSACAGIFSSNSQAGSSHCLDRAHRIAFNTWNCKSLSDTAHLGYRRCQEPTLHETINWIASQAEVVLNGNLSCVLDDGWRCAEACSKSTCSTLRVSLHQTLHTKLEAHPLPLMLQRQPRPCIHPQQPRS